MPEKSSSHTMSDEEIIEGIRNQDDKTINWLYNNYLQIVRHHVFQNSGSEVDVSDVFQESIIVLYRRIMDDKLTLSVDLKGFFFGIVKNIWKGLLRYKYRITYIEYDIAEEPSADEFEDQLMERIVARAFGKLKSDAQTVLKLYSEGLTYSEIASLMGLKNETYARRKKYLSKEALITLIKKDPEYKYYFGRG